MIVICLKKERLKRSLTLRQLESLCKIPRSTLNEIELGYRCITLEEVFRLRFILKCKTSDIVKYKHDFTNQTIVQA